MISDWRKDWLNIQIAIKTFLKAKSYVVLIVVKWLQKMKLYIVIIAELPSVETVELWDYVPTAWNFGKPR